MPQDELNFIGLDNPNDSNNDMPIGDGSKDDSTTSPQSTTFSQTPTPPHKITVHVLDNKSPIILLFGAPSSGKTMTLVRLAKYLRSKGYTLSVDNNFCTDAWEYAENAQKFNSMLGTSYALSGTGRNDFLFVKVCDNRGNTVCQILEGAGEDYFPSSLNADGERARSSFPPYMTGIFREPNKKIWIFITEPDWRVTYNDKVDYVARIDYCKRQYFASKDKSIILYNKIDKTQFLSGPGMVNEKASKKACDEEYPGLFKIFENKGVFSMLQEKYSFKFVPYSTGSYGDPIPGEQSHYDPSHDSYPAKLWEAIKTCIK